MEVFVERRSLYSEIQQLLINRSYHRRHCILFGEFGVGKTTLLRDLFKGYEWNRISRSNRLLSGILFLNYINTVKNEVVPLLKRLLN